MKNALPKGPLRFQVYGIGYVSGNPNVYASVNHELRNFVRKLGEWFVDADRVEQRLDPEEKQFLEEIWTKEKQKMGLPDHP